MKIKRLPALFGAALLAAGSALAISPVPFLNNTSVATFEPIPGLGDLTNGLYMDWRLGSLTPTKGPTFSITRATATTSVDSSDLVVNIASGQPRWHRIGAGSGITGISVYGAHTNIVLQSEDFGTTWAATSATSPTRTAANATVGVVVLDLLGDDSAILAEGYTQTITYTADAVKSISLYYKCGTSTSSAIRQRDNTALANRLLTVITCSGGVPSSAETTGTEESGSPDALAGGVYRFRYATTSVTAANTNVLEVYPAADAALLVTPTGNANFGGVMVQNALSSFPYVKTTTAAVTVNADVVTAAGAGVINQTEGTLFVQAVGAVDAATGNRFPVMLDNGSVAESILFQQSGGALYGRITDGNVVVMEITSGTLVAGAIGKAAIPYKLNDSNSVTNGTAGTTDTICTMPTTTTIRLGYPTAGFEPNTVIQVTALSATRATNANAITATTP